MAGRRRGTDKPLRRDAVAARRRERLQTKTLAAPDQVGRLAAAAEYLRSALRRNPDAVASTRIEDLIQQIVAAGDAANQGVL
jgi:hypothetical protein